MNTLVNLLLAAILQIMGAQAQDKTKQNALTQQEKNTCIVADTAAIETQSIYCIEPTNNHPSKNEHNLNETNSK